MDLGEVSGVDLGEEAVGAVASEGGADDDIVLFGLSCDAAVGGEHCDSHSSGEGVIGRRRHGFEFFFIVVQKLIIVVTSSF